MDGPPSAEVRKSSEASEVLRGWRSRVGGHDSSAVLVGAAIASAILPVCGAWELTEVS